MIRPMKRVYAFILAVLLAFSIIPPALSEQPGQNDIVTDWGEVHYGYDKASETAFYVIRIYRELENGTIQRPYVYAPFGSGSSTASAYDIAGVTGGNVVINAGIFVEENVSPDGLVIQDGEVINAAPTMTYPKCLPLTVNKNGDLSCAKYNADGDTLVRDGIVAAVTGFIPIVARSKAYPQDKWNSVAHYTQRAQRQIIGQFENGDYCIVTCEGRSFGGSKGWTLKEAQEICLKLKLRFAYNLDGSTSAETVFDGRQINMIYANETGRYVPTYIVFGNDAEFPELCAVLTEGELFSVEGDRFVSDGQPFYGSIVPDEGCVLESASYTVNGEKFDCPDGIIDIDSVNSDIIVTAVCIPPEGEEIK